MTFALDAATTLTRLPDGTYRAQVDETWWNFQSAFGGWAAALAYEAVRQSDDCRGELASLNAIFPAAIVAGTLTLKVERLIKRARTDFWRVSFFHEDKPESLIFSADLVMTLRRPSDLSYDAAMPEAPAPDTIEPMPINPMAPKWMMHFDQRMFEGRPFSKNLQPRTRTWIKFADDRPFDAKGVVAIADTPMPRVFFVTDVPKFGSTVSFSVHILAGDEQLKATDGPLLIEADSAGVFDGSYDQRVQIWSPSGTLLAVSNQLAFYR